MFRQNGYIEKRCDNLRSIVCNERSVRCQQAADSGRPMTDKNGMIGRQDSYKYKPNSDFGVVGWFVVRSFVGSLVGSFVVR